MQIVPLADATPEQREQLAAILWREFRPNYPDAWPTLADARAEVAEALDGARIGLMAVAAGTVCGWIGGIPEYDGNVWELHPLVVASPYQRRGVGRQLVAALEQAVIARGGFTIRVGTDDEDGRTTLGGVDVYPDVLRHVADVRNLNNHPFEFYIKNGFALVGIIPDANGFGKPDILLAKRVRSFHE